ncbi:hypothetical protein F4810DRAFT_665627 [Camillea tinctor]|nr:hypothetical protein F4810DRAFT_665627 [Camillea tinctor]
MYFLELLKAIAGFFQPHTNDECRTEDPPQAKDPRPRPGMRVGVLRIVDPRASEETPNRQEMEREEESQLSVSETEPDPTPEPPVSPILTRRNDGRLQCAVDARDMEVIEALFYRAGVPASGQLRWSRLDRLMIRCGFTSDVSRNGCRIAFVPGPDAFVPNGITGGRLVLHRRHPQDGPLDLQSMRSTGRKLHQAFGWTHDMFYTQ